MPRNGAITLEELSTALGALAGEASLRAEQAPRDSSERVSQEEREKAFREILDLFSFEDTVIPLREGYNRTRDKVRAGEPVNPRARFA